jgi:hypothetical protein
VSNCVLIHDGAPAYFTCYVKQFSDSHYPDRWRGRNEPVLWPPRSPDLTPIDFYLWSAVCSERVNMRDEVWRLIQAAVKIIRHMSDFVSVPGILGITGLSNAVTGSIFSKFCRHFASIKTLCWNLIHKCAPRIQRCSFDFLMLPVLAKKKKRVRQCVYSKLLAWF